MKFFISPVEPVFENQYFQKIEFILKPFNGEDFL